MSDELNRKEFHDAIDTALSGLQADPWMARRVIAQSYQRNTHLRRRSLSIGFILITILILVFTTALAVWILSGKEFVEQKAVPVANANDSAYYSYAELKELIKSANENGITLDEGTYIIQALDSGHGYWEQDTIRELCKSAFGCEEKFFSIEQKHWYGEMMVSIGAWGINFWILPEEDELSVKEARDLSLQLLASVYGQDFTIQYEGCSPFSEVYELQWDSETDCYPRDSARWCFWYRDDCNTCEYFVSFDRYGQYAETSMEIVEQLDEDRVNLTIQPSSAFKDKESAAVQQYGSVYYFWPFEVQVDVYGSSFAIPDKTDYEQAVSIAKNAIAEQIHESSLRPLEDYNVGAVYQKSFSEDGDRRYDIWDIIFTTDTHFVSDGYRILFTVDVDLRSGQLSIRDLSIENANIGNG